MGIIIGISIIFAFGAITVYGILNNVNKRYNTLTLQTERERMKSDMDFVVATFLLLAAILVVLFILFIISFFFL